jgi:hypothetical protein
MEYGQPNEPLHNNNNQKRLPSAVSNRFTNHHAVYLWCMSHSDTQNLSTLTQSTNFHYQFQLGSFLCENKFISIEECQSIGNGRE